MSVHVYAYAVHSVLMCTDLGLTAAGEPLSPMSDCRSKGLHYTVKYIREKRAAGVECLLCGLIGPLENLKKVACLPCFPESGDNATGHVELTQTEQVAQDAEALASAELQFRKMQEIEDRKCAMELAELQRQEAELEKMVLLQRLEAEEAELQGLLNEQRALAIAEKMIAKKLSFSDVTPEPIDHPRRAQAQSQLEPETPKAEPDCAHSPLVSVVPPHMDLPYGARVMYDHTSSTSRNISCMCLCD